MTPAAPVRNEGRRALFETRLYAAFPLPQAVATVLIAAVFFGAYAGLSYGHGRPVLEASGLTVNAQIALIMSLLLATALDLPERARRIWLHEADALRATLEPAGSSIVDGLGVGQPAHSAAANWLWFAGGAVVGMGFNALMVSGSGEDVLAYIASPGLWPLVVAPLLFGLGGRAIRLMTEDDRTISSMVADHLIVDFADLERLHVYGRVGLRSGLIWLIMAGLVLAFLAVQASVSASAISFCLAIAAALWSMLTLTRPVAAKVEAAKGAALLEVRRDIVRVHNDGGAPQGRLADLVSYESWLERRPIWPVSAPVTRRFALYGLIPVLAWFGAAAAELVLDALA
ncbi:MAG: hypothetical protein NXI12_05470 [Alphaproteobacteria bacterium]|nr:hypothetical protein [Alphaproteobacteria bacterium]